MSTKFVIIQVITLSRIPLALTYFFLEVFTSFSAGHGVWWAVLFFTLIEISDGLDGHLARKNNLVSEFGKVMDPYADSISRLLVYFALAISNHVFLFVPIVMAMRDITVANARMTLIRNNVTPAARFSGKFKAVIQAVGAFSAILIPYFLHELWNVELPWLKMGISIVVATVTFLSAFEYVRDAFRSVKG